MADETTPPEVRAMVDQTLDLLRAQVGAVRSVRRPSTPPVSVQRQLELIRRQVEAATRKTAEGR